MTVTLQGVATTGIYCRSTCTAQPHPRNVTRYPTSVAAEAAGYRPCLRCRPDRLPEPHLPAVAPPAVAHALVLISDGYLDTHTEDALGRAVGYSGRQLRRLFQLHVGASPAFVARSRRAHFARRLLDETDLSLAAVATAAGYQSTRQLHRAVTATFAFSPSELRAKRRGADRTVDDGGLRLHVPYDGPLDRTRLRRHLGPRTAPGVDHLDSSGVYRRTFETCGSPGLIDLDLSGTFDNGHGELAVVAHLPTMATLIDDVARSRHLLGLGHPLASFQALTGDDLLGAELAARPGLRVPGSWDRFESLIRIVIGQQVSLRGAATLVGRVAASTGRPIPGADERAGVVFPDPATLAAADLDGLGLTTRRIATIRTIAGAVAGGSLDLFRFATLDDLVAGYQAFPGIGPWTAHMAALRLHRHPDAFPAGDLGLRKGAARLLGLAEPLPASDLTALAERWRPHRALAAQLLWTINEEGLLT